MWFSTNRAKISATVTALFSSTLAKRDHLTTVSLSVVVIAALVTAIKYPKLFN
jgi:hypothetical protein